MNLLKMYFRIKDFYLRKGIGSISFDAFLDNLRKLEGKGIFIEEVRHRP